MVCFLPSHSFPSEEQYNGAKLRMDQLFPTLQEQEDWKRYNASHANSPRAGWQNYFKIDLPPFPFWKKGQNYLKIVWPTDSWLYSVLASLIDLTLSCSYCQ